MQWRPAPIQAPPHYPRGALLDWIRGHAPDLRIIHVTRDGSPACGAAFTFRGAEHRYFVVRGQQRADGSPIDDPSDEIVRICHQAIARLIGLPGVPGRSRVEREREIVAASARGDTAMAERLGSELAADNERETRRRAQLRTQFGNRPIW